MQVLAENERKAKRISGIYLTIFLLLTMLNVCFAVMWRMSQKELRKTNEALIISNEALKSMSANFQDANAQLKNARSSDSLIQRSKDSALKRLDPRAFAIIKSEQVKAVNIYMQYIDSYKSTVDSAGKALLAAGYNPLGNERMRLANFNSCVKYFHDSDMAMAQQIAGVLNNSLLRFRQSPIRLIRQNISAPAGQFEVWLGEKNTAIITDITTTK